MRKFFTLVVIAASLTGCTVHPAGESDERAAAARLGNPFEKPIETREVVPLQENPTLDQIIEYALLNNADLEQRYWTWRATIEQIPQDGTQSTSLNIAAGTNITNGRASWGRTTLTVGNDPMTDIKWPGKLDAAARQTLENARAAGRRFVKAKYDLRGKVLGAYYDYALTAKLIQLEEANTQLLEITVDATAARNRVGGTEQDVLKASNELALSHNDAANMRSQLDAQRAALNALLNRPPNSALPVPTDAPAMRHIAYSDEAIINLAVKNNPELIALADEIRGRQDGIRLAKLQYFPDFNFSAGTDLVGITQSVLGQATIPIFRYEAIQAAIAQAEANLRASEAMRRQAHNDLAAQVVSDIITIRDADRQLDLFDRTILPRTHQIVETIRSAYETGHENLLDLLDDQRAEIATERLVANLKAVRERRLADLEAITTIDLSDGVDD